MLCVQRKEERTEVFKICPDGNRNWSLVNWHYFTFFLPTYLFWLSTSLEVLWNAALTTGMTTPNHRKKMTDSSKNRKEQSH